MESKLSDVRGRVDYISSPERQEHLYAVYSDVQDHYWELLAEQNQKPEKVRMKVYLWEEDFEKGEEPVMIVDYGKKQ